MAINAKVSPGRTRLAPICATVIIVAGAILSSSAASASAPIYKCLDSQLGLVYTDQPCKGGEQVDIHAGDPDPQAAARLERARDEIERRSLVRLAEERRVAAEKQMADFSRRQREEDVKAAAVASEASYDNDALTWYPAYLTPRARRPHARPPPDTAAPRTIAPRAAPAAPRS